MARRAGSEGSSTSPARPIPTYGKVPRVCGGMAEPGRRVVGVDQDKELDAVAAYVATFARVGPDVTPGRLVSMIRQVKEPTRDTPPVRKGMQPSAIRWALPATRTRSPSKRAPDLFAYGSPRWIFPDDPRSRAPRISTAISRRSRRCRDLSSQLNETQTSRCLVRYLSRVTTGSHPSRSRRPRPPHRRRRLPGGGKAGAPIALRAAKALPRLPFFRRGDENATKMACLTGFFLESNRRRR